MADAPESTPKIDSLRAKVEADSKSRHFYPLAEELRKIGQLDEAEKVLRTGLEHHSSYLSAWISLGRVLKDRGTYPEAIDALMKGLSLDPENVVAAKLLAHVYLAMGEKVEAIKKFKLVHALMPADEEAEEQIAILEGELNAPEEVAGASLPPATPPAPEALAPEEPPHDSTEPPFPVDDAPPMPPPPPPEAGHHGQEPDFDLTNPAPFALGGEAPAAEPELADEPPPFADSELPERTMETDSSGVDEDPFSSTDPVAHEPVQPRRAPSSEDIWAEEDEASEGLPESAATVTMAQILVQQGHLDQAKDTFERVLAREPGNEAARRGLDALEAREKSREDAGSRSERLEAWRRKVVRT